MDHETILVDWGTSAFRAWRVGPGGAVRDARADPRGGIAQVAGGAFVAALRQRIGDWLRPTTPVWLSGMVTSRNGWVEVPYAAVPAGLADLAAGALERRLDDGVQLHFVPGVCAHAPTPDVMRGEEVQVFGQLADAPSAVDATIVLPGTHSKWVQVKSDAIVGFRTHLTGELYALLVEHSIVGRLAAGDAPPDDAAFARGVRFALARRPGGLLHEVFTARSAVLLGELTAGGVRDYLSGLLIGHELREELAGLEVGRVPVLIGETALIERYRRAFAIAGAEAVVGEAQAARRGLARVAGIAAEAER